jgi:hypothetical protein
MKDLRGRSVLFFSPQFFNYENEIKKKLEELGATVKWFDDRPSNNFVSKVLIRFNKNFISKKITKHYSAIIEELRLNKSQFDYVFFLNPEAISVNSLKEFKEVFPEAKFILYMWDSFQNRKKTKDLLPFFNSKFTFDAHDAQNFNLQLRPLFYIDLYSAKENEKIIYDFLFIGTAHTDRYKFVNRLVDQIPERFKIKLYFFLSSKLLFWAKKVVEKDFRRVDYKNISFNPLTHKSNSELVHKSKVILDINHPKQIGLTMRTFEALGAQRKLITTNADVANYDFYDETNILIIDRLNPIINEEFLIKPFNPTGKDILMKYCIRGWINDLFDLS